MKLLLSLLALAVAANAVTITDIVLYIDRCGDCGMTTLGQISIEICGESACCYKQDMGSSYSEDSVYILNGVTIGECENFELGDITEDTTSMTLFHSGTDAIMFLGVSFDFEQDDGSLGTYECRYDHDEDEEDYFKLDNEDWVVLNRTDCNIINF